MFHAASGLKLHQWEGTWNAFLQLLFLHVFEYGVTYGVDPTELNLAAVALGHLNLFLSSEQVIEEMTHACRGANELGIAARHPARVVGFIIRLAAHSLAQPGVFQRDGSPPAADFTYPVTTLAAYYG